MSFFKSWFLLMLLVQTSLAQPVFTDVTTEAGIDHYFQVFYGTFGGGAAVFDYNGDGFEDVFITGGIDSNHLYENEGNGTFLNVSEGAGMNVLNGKVTQGAVSADVNKDGYPDLFITTIALTAGNGFKETADVLLINNGDGTFSDKSQQYGLLAETFSTGASFGDINRDGYPDLYVSTYFKDFEGRLDQYSGTMLNNTNGPAGDLLYINDGGARFIESSSGYGLDHIGLGFQGVWSDIDNDRDPDLLIANDFGSRGHPNYLYRNEFPEKKLTEIGQEMNFDYGINGMGIGVCDFNMDGWMDYLVTNIQKSPFFVNQGINQPFKEMSGELRTAYSIVYTNSGAGVPPISWGVNFFDFDLDMDEDLYITNGCLNPGLIPNPNLLFENIDGVFWESGYITNTNDISIGRGSAVFDYDNDGDLDILVVNQIPHKESDLEIEFVGTRLFRNETNNGNNWLKVKLQGRVSEKNGIGSRVEVYVDGHRLIREIDGGSGHESQNSSIAHFGLGTYQKADSVIVYWSRYGSQTLYDVPADQLLTVDENLILSIRHGSTDLDLDIYPLPFNDHLFIQVPSQTDIRSVKFLRLTGQLVWEVANISGRSEVIKLDISPTIPAGIYLMHITTDKEAISMKIIKSH